MQSVVAAAEAAAAEAAAGELRQQAEAAEAALETELETARAEQAAAMREASSALKARCLMLVLSIGAASRRKLPPSAVVLLLFMRTVVCITLVPILQLFALRPAPQDATGHDPAASCSQAVLRTCSSAVLGNSTDQCCLRLPRTRVMRVHAGRQQRRRSTGWRGS